MSQALHILAKDLRRLRFEIALTLVLFARLAASSPDTFLFWDALANFLVPLGCGVLVTSAIQDEPLTGDRMFWLTRPYRRSSLILAKALFCLLCVNLPLLLSDAIQLLRGGYLPMQHLGGLLAHQAYPLIFLLPVVALASVTRTLTQATLSFAAAVTAVPLLAARLIGLRGDWSVSFTLMLFSGIVLVFCPIAIAAQYRLRATMFSRVWLAVGCLLAVLAPVQGAFALRSTLNPSGLASPSIALGTGKSPSTTRLDEYVYVRIPVTVNSLPAGVGVLNEQTEIRLRSGNTRFEQSATLDPPGSPQWLAFYARPFHYRELARQDLHVSGSAQLALVRERNRRRVPLTAISSREPDPCRFKVIDVTCRYPTELSAGIRTAHLVNRVTGDVSPSATFTASPGILVPFRTEYAVIPNVKVEDYIRDGTWVDYDYIITTYERVGSTSVEFDFPSVPLP